jgi:hypothetical protein
VTRAGRAALAEAGPWRLDGDMTYVEDIKDPLSEESLEGFPMTVADEEIRDWSAGLCPGR